MDYQKTDLGPRLLAALIDFLIAWVFVVIPVIGALIGAAYLLLRDAILFEVTKNEEWRNRSIGKKLMKLEVAEEEGKNIDLVLSAKRNLPLTIGNFIAVVPVIGWILGSILGLVLAIIELLLVITDKEGKRLGDRWAQTQVIAGPEGVITDSEEL